MDQEPGRAEPVSESSSPSSSSVLIRRLFALQQQVNQLQIQVQASQTLDLSKSLEQFDRRINSLAGQVDQVKTVQKRLSNRIGTLEEKLRIAEAYSEHQTIVATRLSRRLQEVESRLQ